MDDISSLPPPDPGTGAPAALPRHGRIDAYRQLAETAADDTQRAEMVQAAQARHAADRLAAAAHLWPVVNHILGVISTNADLQRITQQFELTRNKDQDAAQRRHLEAELGPRLAQETRRLPRPVQGHELAVVYDLVYDEILGISVVGPFWRDDEVTEILIDGWDSITIERGGVLLRTPVKFRDFDHARTVARNLAQKVSDRTLTPANPIVTAELPGARVAFAIGKIVKSGIAVAIRKFRPLLDMNGLLGAGALTPEMCDFLVAAVRARANVVVSGGTGSGKTTLINAMSAYIPDGERVITIEDAYELRLTNRHWVAMQTKEKASADDEVSITLADLLVATLRMRPDRVIVGEIRESAAAAVMLQAANTGHDGTMTTIHANSADRAINFRLVSLARTGGGMSDEVAAAEVAMAVNLVVQVVRRHGRRFVSDISVIDPSYLSGALVVPRPVFTGAVVEGQVTHTRVGDVGADTELAMKMIDAGVSEGWVQ